MELFYEFNIVGIVFTAIVGVLAVSTLAALIRFAVVKKPVTAGTRFFRVADIILLVILALAWFAYLLTFFGLFGIDLARGGSDNADLIISINGSPLFTLAGLGAIVSTLHTILATILLGVTTLLAVVDFVLSFALRRRVRFVVKPAEEKEAGGYGYASDETRVDDVPAPSPENEFTAPAPLPTEETEIDTSTVSLGECEQVISNEVIANDEPVINKEAEPEEIANDEPAVNEEFTENAPSDEFVSDEIISEEAAPEEVVSDEIMSDDVASETEPDDFLTETERETYETERETESEGQEEILFEEPLDPGFTLDESAEEPEPATAETATEEPESIYTETATENIEPVPTEEPDAVEDRPEFIFDIDEDQPEKTSVEEYVAPAPERSEPQPAAGKENPTYVYAPENAPMTAQTVADDGVSVSEVSSVQSDDEPAYGFAEYSEFAETDRLGGQVSDKKFSSALQLPENYENKIHPSEHKHGPIAVPMAKKPATERSGSTPEVKKTEEKLAVQMPPLPVTRKLVITNRMNVVNMFNDYLNEKDKNERDKLASSIGKIIIK